MDLVFTTGAEAENVTLRSAGWTYLGGTTSTRSDRRTIWTFSFLSTDDIVGGTSKSLDFYLSYTGDTYIPGGLRLPEIGADGYSKITGADAVTGNPLMQDNLLTRTSA